MTGRTHDLAAFTALNMSFLVEQPLPDITLATAVTALGANMLGGLAPDIDDASSDFWDKIRGGSFLGKLIKPLTGGHRMISHSILGMAVAGWIAKLVLAWMNTFMDVDISIIWWAFMIGYFSHLFADSLTKQGVPWLFPLPIRFGFPPFAVFRMETGGILEKSVIFPGLLVFNGWLFYISYEMYIEFFRKMIG